MTLVQAHWAARHDWCLRIIRTVRGYVVIACNDYYDPDAGRWIDSTICHSDFRQMTAWAGY